MAGKQPTHTVRAKTGRKDDAGDDIFFSVGVAWPFPNGKGFSLRVNALPVGFDGNLLLTENKEE